MEPPPTFRNSGSAARHIRNGPFRFAFIRRSHSSSGISSIVETLRTPALFASTFNLQNAIQKTVEAFGKLNVLANNAGVLSVSTIEEIPEDEWDRLINANLKGPFLMCRAALPEFRKVGGGSIVNVGSVLGLVAMKKRAAYCASKGGLTLLTKAIAIDHGHENIRANCICPSIVETDLVSELFKTPDGERAKLERLATIPLARFGKPNDIAGLAVFLASDESSWLTGAAIPVDGGLTAA